MAGKRLKFSEEMVVWPCAALAVTPDFPWSFAEFAELSRRLMAIQERFLRDGPACPDHVGKNLASTCGC